MNHHSPIAAEGLPWIAVPAVFAIIALALGWRISAIILCLLTLFVVWFFRNPERKIPKNSKFIISPANGKVLRIEEASGDLVDSCSRKVVLGSLAGILPGLFGIGTGAVLVPGFAYLLKAPIKTAVGSALVCFAANAFISAAMKSAQGYIDYSVAIPLCIGTLVGSQIGAVINHRSPSVLIQVLFSLVFSWVSLRFILSALGVVN